MLVSQVARVHSVVWERAGDVLETIRAMAAPGASQDPSAAEAARKAGCVACAKRLIGQGEMLVDKQPGMAYALAALALTVGEHEPGVWASLEAQLRANCCYIVPHYVRRPASGDADEWKMLLGYAKRADGKNWESKQDYYQRMAGFVTLYAALLQQSTVGHFRPPSEEMETRSIVNPLGVAAAWRWLARLLNQKPQRISATLLLAFLKPSSHALAHAYPRQFFKLLKLIETSFIVKIHTLIDDADAPEEKAALSNLETWLGTATKELAAGRPLTEPAETEMAVFKEPDNTSDSRGEDW